MKNKMIKKIRKTIIKRIKHNKLLPLLADAARYERILFNESINSLEKRFIEMRLAELHEKRITIINYYNEV